MSKIIKGVLVRYTRKAPVRDRWDDRKSTWHATTNGVETLCGRGQPILCKNHVSEQGWGFLSGYNWNDVSCSWCLKKKEK